MRWLKHTIQGRVRGLRGSLGGGADKERLKVKATLEGGRLLERVEVERGGEVEEEGGEEVEDIF